MGLRRLTPFSIPASEVVSDVSFSFFGTDVPDWKLPGMYAFVEKKGQVGDQR